MEVAAHVVIDLAQQPDAINTCGDAPTGKLAIGFILGRRSEQFDAHDSRRRLDHGVLLRLPAMVADSDAAERATAQDVRLRGERARVVFGADDIGRGEFERSPRGVGIEGRIEDAGELRDVSRPARPSAPPPTVDRFHPPNGWRRTIAPVMCRLT